MGPRRERGEHVENRGLGRAERIGAAGGDEDDDNAPEDPDGIDRPPDSRLSGGRYEEP
jgi:hypothetical protein